MKPFIRCVATCADGSRCAKAARRGSNPALCAFHDGSTQSAVVMPDDQIDEVKILRKLARDRNPQVRLRAVDLLLSIKKEQPRDPRSDADAFIKALSSDERSELTELLGQLRAFKERIYAREPELRPDSDTPRQTVSIAVPCDSTTLGGHDHGTERQHDQPPGTVAAVPEPPAVEPAAAAVRSDAEVSAAPLARELWNSVGLFELNGVVTHSLGDDHAAKILRGEIPLEVARDQHQEAERHANGMNRRRP